MCRKLWPKRVWEKTKNSFTLLSFEFSTSTHVTYLCVHSKPLDDKRGEISRPDSQRRRRSRSRIVFDEIENVVWLKAIRYNSYCPSPRKRCFIVSIAEHAVRELEPIPNKKDLPTRRHPMELPQFVPIVVAVNEIGYRNIFTKSFHVATFPLPRLQSFLKYYRLIR